MKTIKITEQTHKRLLENKVKLGKKTIDETITWILDCLKYCALSIPMDGDGNNEQ